MNPANARDIVQKNIIVPWLHWWKWNWTAAQATAASATGIHAAITMTTAVQEITTGITQPSVARCISITGGYAGEVGTAIIRGTNIEDEPIEESITLNGTSTVPGTKAFKTVTKIYVPARTQTTTPTIAIGTTEKLGLPLRLPSTDCVHSASRNGTVEGTAPTVTVDASDISKNTVDLNSALNGTIVSVLGYIYT